MRIDEKLLAKSLASNFFVKSTPRPFKSYHLRFVSKLLSWTYARDVQNAIIKAYQSHHHLGYNRRPLPPTILTFRIEPVFTYGRREERPSQEDRRKLESYSPWEGVYSDTRMAWDREYGWRYHGPGQMQCWMVADLESWKWNSTDVYDMMHASLHAMVQHYSPYQSLNQQSSSIDIDRLASVELHENNYKIISHGCSINITVDQSLGTERLLQYGFPCEGVSTLSERGWHISEEPTMLQDRIVAELSRRIGTIPEEIDIPTLSRKLGVEIPTEDTAFDRKDAYLFREQIKKDIAEHKKDHEEKVAARGYKSNTRMLPPTPPTPTLPETLLNPPTDLSTLAPKTDPRRRVYQIQPSRSPKSITEQTIQWSTASEVFFTPRAVEGPPARRIVVSPLELSESEYLDDKPSLKPEASKSSTQRSVNVKKDKDMKSRMEQQKRIMQILRATGDDRI